VQQPPGKCLGKTPHVVHRESLADDRPPATGTELDDVLFFDPAGPHDALLQDDLRGIQVLLGVDAPELLLIDTAVGLDASARSRKSRYGIREGVHAQTAVLLQGGEHVEQARCPSDVRAQVQLADIAGLLIHVGFLDDADHAAVGSAHDAPVRERLVADPRKDGQVGPLEAVARQHAAQRREAKEGRIPVEDHEIARKPFEQGTGLQDGVAGAQCLFLEHVAIAWARVLLDGAVLVAHDDGCVLGRAELPRQVQHIVHDGAVAERLQRPRLAVPGPAPFRSSKDEHSQFPSMPLGLSGLGHARTSCGRPMRTAALEYNLTHPILTAAGELSKPFREASCPPSAPVVDSFPAPWRGLASWTIYDCRSAATEDVRPKRRGNRPRAEGLG